MTPLPGRTSDNTTALFFAFLVLVLWASVATAFKIALEYLRPFELLFLSSLVSFLALSVIMLVSGRFRKLKELTRNDCVRLVLAGILNPVIYYLILFKAYDLLPAQYAQAVNFTWPLVLALTAMIAGHEKFHFLRVLALCVSFAGALVVVLGGKQLAGGISIPGVLLAFFSTFIWVAYWMIAKTIKADPVISLWVPFTTGAAVLSLMACFLFRPAALSPAAWAGAGYVGLFEMSITFLFWLTALRKASSTALVSNFIYAVPFLSLIFIRFVLNEPIRPTTLIGLIMIAGGIAGQMWVHQNKRLRFKD